MKARPVLVTDVLYLVNAQIFVELVNMLTAEIFELQKLQK